MLLTHAWFFLLIAENGADGAEGDANGNASGKRVFVGNLSWTTQWQVYFLLPAIFLYDAKS
jgi:hypothetical protein